MKLGEVAGRKKNPAPARGAVTSEPLSKQQPSVKMRNSASSVLRNNLGAGILLEGIPALNRSDGEHVVSGGMKRVPFVMGGSGENTGSPATLSCLSASRPKSIEPSDRRVPLWNGVMFCGCQAAF